MPLIADCTMLLNSLLDNFQRWLSVRLPQVLPLSISASLRNRSTSGATRSFRFESLENRELLTATGLEPSLPIETSSIQQLATQDPVSVSGIDLNINGNLVQLDASQSFLQVQAGDVLKVDAIHLSVTDGLQVQEGVFALEGYVSKLEPDRGSDSPAQIDYSDGRYSSRNSNPAVATGNVVVGGFDQGWNLTDGWDRLTLNVVHYFGNQSQTVSTIQIALQVGTPDFTFAPDVFQALSENLVVGKEVSLVGSWLNQDAGRYHNYAEVDVFFAGESMPEWVGVLVGNADAQDPVSGEFLFPTDSGNQFTERWVPTRAGKYIVEFTVDPEHLWNEADESNNRVRLEVDVAEAITQVDVGDTGKGVVAQDKAHGTGFIMYSEESVHQRFANNRIYPQNADHFVTVRHHDGKWQYDSNSRYVDFEIRDSDVLIAQVDFTDDKVMMLQGLRSTFNGAKLGYAESDLKISPNQWGGHKNMGEFGLNGSHIGFYSSYPNEQVFANETVQISESAKSGTVVLQLDQRGAGRPSFEIVRGNKSGLFEVDPTGQLVLVGTLDYESVQRHDLLIEATRNGQSAWFRVRADVQDSAADLQFDIGNVNRGVAAQDHASGKGFLMFSETNVHQRFAAEKIYPDSSDHLVAVKFLDGKWYVDNNSRYISFQPQETDVLIAKVDFGKDNVKILKGDQGQYQGIQQGVADTDLQVRANYWGNQKNRGEFGVKGSTIRFNS